MDSGSMPGDLVKCWTFLLLPWPLEMGRGAALTTSGGGKIKDAASTSGPDHQGENRKRSKMSKLCQPSYLSESFKMRENIFKKF